MPATKTKIKKGKNKGKYRVRTPGGVKAKAATKGKADSQIRLLNAIDHGFKPTGKPARSKKKTTTRKTTRRTSRKNN